jgi:hypothetical protein
MNAANNGLTTASSAATIAGGAAGNASSAAQAQGYLGLAQQANAALEATTFAAAEEKNRDEQVRAAIGAMQ